MTAIALTIAGSDSGGGAGIQADLKTFSALKVYGASVLTALTAQNTLGVRAIHDVPPDFVSAQIAAVLEDLKVAAIKIGMLSKPGTIAAVADALRKSAKVPVVLDPVMIAASGDPLIRPAAITALKRQLLPLARLVTPNLPEAARLCGGRMAASEAQMLDQAERILKLGAQAVLIKGGHGEGAESVDLLVDEGSVVRLAAPRVPGSNVHGTGCTLSSAIAAGLARGLELESAVRAGKDYVTAAIRASAWLKIGHGHGPTHHFHEWW